MTLNRNELILLGYLLKSWSLKFTHTAHMCGGPKQSGGTKSWWTWKLISFESWGNQSVELTKIEEECKYFFYPLTLAVAWIHVPVLALWQHCWKCCFFKQIYSTGKKFEPNPFKQGWEQSNLPLKYRLWSENKIWSFFVYLLFCSSAALSPLLEPSQKNWLVQSEFLKKYNCRDAPMD